MFNFFSAAIYLRLSREDEDKHEDVSNSIINQKTIINQFISKQDDISIFDYYTDDGKTGTNFERPGFQKLLQDLYSKKINCIIVKDLSRLGRNYIEVGRYLEYIFPTQNIRFIAINDNIDSYKNPKSLENMVVPFKNLINDEYVRDISKKVKSVFNMQKRRGDVLSGGHPYGYKLDKNNIHKLVVDKKTAEIVKEIFKMKLDGMSSGEIAKNLNERKIKSPSVYKNFAPSRRCSYWTTNTIGIILRNQTYCGDTIGNKSQKVSYKLKKIKYIEKENWIIVKGTHEPIISYEDFEKVQSTFKSTQNKRKHTTRENMYLGKIFCGECNKALMMFYSASTKRATAYSCPTPKLSGSYACSNDKSIKIEDLNELVKLESKKKMKKLLKLSNDYIESHIDNSIEIEKINAQINELNKNLNDYLKARMFIVLDYKSGNISKDDFAFYESDFDKKILNLNKEINILKDQAFTLNKEIDEITELRDTIKRFRRIKEVSKDFIDVMIEKVFVYPEKNVKVKLNNENFILKACGKRISIDGT